ncbi:MAG: HAMP domain-containing sensor histidine kinase [Verrucomicrobiota bacterium]|nr:HAMP domain-containing sensor histidine kinase [Verrucomicrobiota bacterium]
MAKTGLKSSPMRLAALVTAITLLVFGVTLSAVTLQLRAKIRNQIAGRDAQILNNLAASLPLQTTRTNGFGEFVETGGDTLDEQGMPDPDLGIPLGPADSDVEALLQSERLRETTQRLRGLLAKGLLAVRLYDAAGRPLLPPEPAIAQAKLASEQLEKLRRFEPISIYKPAVHPQEVFGHVADEMPPSVALPLLEVLIPIRSVDGTRFVGVNQILLDGTGVANEFSALDQHLVRQGIIVFLGGGVAITTALMLAFRRLQRVNQLLAERTASLVKANTDLARSARAAAVGAVTAHLMHGLKNPVAGLQQYLSGLGQTADAENDVLRTEAANITRRMQTMIQEVARVLREEDGTAAYEVTLGELSDMVLAKANRTAAEHGVTVTFSPAPNCTLSNHQANLIMLILENLISNAIQATPKGKAVTVSLVHRGGELDCQVSDEGAGVPPDVQPRLFSPLRSTKPDGLGMGLAISKQLAEHVGAKLELRSTGPQGSVFALVVPLGKGG